MICRCPKCGGNLRLEKEDTGWELDCLQCGFRYIPGQAPPLPHVIDCKLQPNKAERALKPGGRPLEKINHLTPQIGCVLNSKPKESRWRLQRKKSMTPRLNPGGHHNGGSKYV